MARKNHLLSIDLIRLISFLAILMVHVSKVIFERYTQVDNLSWWISMFLNSTTKFGTPMFIMVSGYLLLKSDTVNRPKEFYKKRASKIIWPLIFWNIFYYFLYAKLNLVPVGWHDFYVRFISGGTYYHLYFLQLIAGLYVISPLLVKVINKYNLNILVSCLILLSFGYLVANNYGYFPELNNTFLWFIPYIGYYLAGYWIGNQKMNLNKWWGLVVIGLMLVGVIGQGNFLAHRLSLSVAIASILLFWLIIKIERLPKWLNFISHYGMGLYLIHPLVIEFFIRDGLIKYPVLWMMTTYIGTLGLSFFWVRIGIMFLNVSKRLYYRRRFGDAHS